MNMKLYTIKILFAFFIALIYLLSALISSKIINKIMSVIVLNEEKNKNINLINQIIIRTLLIIITIYSVRTIMRYYLSNKISIFDIEYKKQIERNVFLMSFSLFLLQPKYSEDIKELYNKSKLVI